MTTPSQTGPASMVRRRTAPPERRSAPARHRRYRGAVITIQRAVIASAPAEVVFAYLSDFTNAAEWDAGTVSCVLLTGDGAVGSTYANTSKFMGMSTELTYELVELEADRLIVLRGENRTVTSTDHILIQSVERGTEVLYTAEYEFKGVAKLLQVVLRAPLEKLADNAKVSLASALSRLESRSEGAEPGSV
jgi:carbon monoxide dehydrogenase subunit G